MGVLETQVKALMMDHERDLNKKDSEEYYIVRCQCSLLSSQTVSLTHTFLLSHQPPLLLHLTLPLSHTPERDCGGRAGPYQ